MYFTCGIGIGGAFGSVRVASHNITLAAPASWGQGLAASIFGRARNKALTLHAIPNICFSYELRRSGEADAGRAYYATLLHHRLHFI
jgi:hypothetical protein